MTAATNLRIEAVSSTATRHRFRFLAVALLTTAVLIGVFFRFFNIDRRFYWNDEAVTSMSISGHTQTEFRDFIGRLRITTVRDLHRFQSPDGSRELMMSELVGSGAQHPPVYYYASRVWAECFGANPAAMRTISALLSLLLLPATYWLCIELFRSRMVGCIGLAIVALSPIQIAYAQNAREYAFWIGLVAATSACSLRAVRVNNLPMWMIYTGVLTLSLYTNVLTALVAIANSLSALLCHWRTGRASNDADNDAKAGLQAQSTSFVDIRTGKLSPACCQILSCTVAALLFSPWMWAIHRTHESGDPALKWMTNAVPLKTLAKDWTHHVVAFLDLKQEGLQPMFLQLLLCCAIICATVFFMRNASARARFHISTLWLCTLLPFILPDLIYGGIRSAVIRWLFPVLLSMYIVVAYTLAQMLTGKSAVRVAGLTLVTLLFAGELASCYANSQRRVRYEMTIGGQDLSQISQAINQYKKPLIVVDSCHRWAQALSISHLLRPDTLVALYPTLAVAKVPPQFENSLLYNPNQNEPFTLPAGFKTQPVAHNVYKVSKQATARETAPITPRYTGE